jgi:hypothetical protein
MLRVPSVGADRDKRIAALEAKLAELRAVPAHRRSAEFIPEKIESVLEVLAHLRREEPID